METTGETIAFVRRRNSLRALMDFESAIPEEGIASAQRGLFWAIEGDFSEEKTFGDKGYRQYVFRSPDGQIRSPYRRPSESDEHHIAKSSPELCEAIWFA